MAEYLVRSKVVMRELEARVGIGHIFPPLHLKYA